jgi:cell division protein FtsB
MARVDAATIAAPGRVRPRPQPRAKPKPRPRARHKSRSRGAILWIAVSALLLAGVVFVNLAVLRLNLAVDKAGQERTQLRAANHTLQSQLSAALASPRIQSQARRQEGLVPADESMTGYINIAP